MKLLLVLLFVVTIPLAYAAPMDEKQIPPTHAFSRIDVNGTFLDADKYNDILTVTAGENVTIVGNATNDEITFYATGGSGAVSLFDDLLDVIITSPVIGDIITFNGTDWINSLFQINTTSCPAGEFVLSIDNSTGIVTCGTPTGTGGGENNTASNVGTGEGFIFKQKTGDDLEFKTVKQDPGIIITNNTSDITIGTSFFANSVTCSGTDKVSAYNNVTGQIVCTGDEDDSGEANTASNIGTGEASIFKQKNGIDLEFKTLKEGTGISFVNGTDDITISVNISSIHEIGNVTSSGCAETEILKVNSTGYFDCAPDEISIGSFITSINTDSTAAQVFSGSANEITLDDSGAGTIVFDVGTDIVQIDQVQTYNDGIKQTFNPSTTNAGINVGSVDTAPSSPIEGDVFVEGDADKIWAYLGGVWVDLGAGGAGDNLGDHVATQDLDLNSFALNTTEYQVKDRTIGGQKFFELTPRTQNYPLMLFRPIDSVSGAYFDMLATNDTTNQVGFELGSYPGMNYFASYQTGSGVVNPFEFYVNGFTNSRFNTDGSVDFNYDVDINANNLNMTEKTAPSTPSSNRIAIYAKDKSGVSNLYFKDDAGVEHDLGATAGTNALLDGSTHTDTVAQTVTRGSLVYGSSTPKWDELVLGTNKQILISDGTDVKWGNKMTLVASWDSSRAWTNIGTSYVDVYAGTNSNGKAMFIDTTGYTDMRMQIEWNKVGTGTQTCILDEIATGSANIAISIDLSSGSNDSGWVDIPAFFESGEKNYKVQCKSTTSTDDPVIENIAVWLR